METFLSVWRNNVGKDNFSYVASKKIVILSINHNIRTAFMELNGGTPEHCASSCICGNQQLTCISYFGVVGAVRCSLPDNQRRRRDV